MLAAAADLVAENKTERPRILVVGPATRPALVLDQQRYTVKTVAMGQQMGTVLDSFEPQVVLINSNESPGSLKQLIRKVRSSSAAPIIVLSQHDRETDKVAALELGADDYMIKPVGTAELLARVRVALRHAAAWRPRSGQVIRAGNLEIWSEPERRVVRAGRPVRLSPTEYQLLEMLAKHVDKLLTYSMLIDGVWGRGPTSREHLLHVYVARLRKKLEHDPAHPEYLVSEPRVGYRLATRTSLST